MTGMVSVDAFSKMVSAVYACAVEPARMDESITTVYQTLGAKGGALLVSDGAVRTQVAAVLPADAAQTYRQHYWRVDHVLDDVEAGPVGVVRTGSELMAPNHRSEFLNEWNRPNDLEDGMFVRLTAGVAAATFLVTAPRRQDPFGSGDRLKAMNALTAHLQQALRTYGKFAESGRVNQGLVAMVDGMRHGTVLVGPGGQVRCFNSAAECILRAADGLTLSRAMHHRDRRACTGAPRESDSPCGRRRPRRNPLRPLNAVRPALRPQTVRRAHRAV